MFDKIQDLFAAILSKGISQQLKQGLYREYVTRNENLPLMKGKLDVQGTIRNQLQRKKMLSCTYDELSENNIYNQILKTTSYILIKDSSVDKEHRKILKKLMLFLNDVDTIDPKTINWNRLKFQRNNRNYPMLMNICYFILDGLLQTTEKGEYKMTSFSDEHMSKLYEKFVLEYYKYHHQYLQTSSAQVKWNLDPDVDENVIKFLPVMQTDISLHYKEKTLIIDTKYYANTMQFRMNKHTFHSNNLYQIFTYVKNKDAKDTGNVSGMLLYAKTEEPITPDGEFLTGGNRISVKTLDLNRDFSLIKVQLDEIVFSHFGTIQ